MAVTPIHQIQGAGLPSPLAGRRVHTRGVVTGSVRKGFFVQDPDGPRDTGASTGVFVFHRRGKPAVGTLVEVQGRVLDYIAKEGDRPTTQVELDDLTILRKEGPPVEPVWLDARVVEMGGEELAVFLNGIEGMLAGLEQGSTFIAPSNAYGDYVVLPPGADAPRTRHGGVQIDPDRPLRWYPGFRTTDYARAPRVDVGARLARPVIGPLNYRSSSFQIAAVKPPQVEAAEVAPDVTSLPATKTAFTTLTLNGFNLDAWIEARERVSDPRRDVDDDVGDRRFEMLARAIVEGAASPDIVAVQEMQDDDGAEVSTLVSARKNYTHLAADIERLGGPRYDWADAPPLEQNDGGQPGGNIRNGFLYREDRIELQPGSLRRLGDGEPAFEESRKPLLARFHHRPTGREIVVVNVHLASKRHQHGIFAPERPGHDPREPMRIEQARRIRAFLDELSDGVDYYVTGDFNDFEFSETLRTLAGDTDVNLVDRLPADGRYDYNHRGVSQTLMHGLVPRRQAGSVDYEILHGNELIGVKPGEPGGRATDHAYVIARFRASE